MKKTALVLSTLFTPWANAIQVTLAQPSDTGGFFDDWTSLLQYVLNWLSGPFALFICLTLFAAFWIGYGLDPKNEFLAKFLKNGSVVLGILSTFILIPNLYNWFS